MWYKKEQHESGYYIDENNNRYIINECNAAHTVQGLNAGYSRFDSWEDMVVSWDLKGPEPYILPEATATRLGGIKVGATMGIRLDGTLNMLPATTATLGGIIAGDTLDIDADGTLNYNLPTATADRFGSVKIGPNIELLPDGSITTHPEYVLPEATSTTLGGIRIGNNLTLTAGKLSTAANVMLTNHPGRTTVTGLYTFTQPVQVANAVEPDEAAALGQLDEAVGMLQTEMSEMDDELRECMSEMEESLRYGMTWMEESLHSDISELEEDLRFGITWVEQDLRDHICHAVTDVEVRLSDHINQLQSEMEDEYHYTNRFASGLASGMVRLNPNTTLEHALNAHRYSAGVDGLKLNTYSSDAGKAFRGTQRHHFMTLSRKGFANSLIHQIRGMYFPIREFSSNHVINYKISFGNHAAVPPSLDITTPLSDLWQYSASDAATYFLQLIPAKLSDNSKPTLRYYYRDSAAGKYKVNQVKLAGDFSIQGFYLLWSPAGEAGPSTKILGISDIGPNSFASYFVFSMGEWPVTLNPFITGTSYETLYVDSTIAAVPGQNTGDSSTSLGVPSLLIDTRNIELMYQGSNPGFEEYSSSFV